jgi:hypothetical protein
MMGGAAFFFPVRETGKPFKRMTHRRHSSWVAYPTSALVLSVGAYGLFLSAAGSVDCIAKRQVTASLKRPIRLSAPTV